ncbi:putative membrane protein [Chitinophaga jiangningensis]|uniref:Putative membrane protein n=2 Tax=Chitinophaga jiangningensis TaxID=1419482 RepID=A0A1M7E303_9BACT|nr:putative membrane protein [Chitinophaga jiangningensis]
MELKNRNLNVPIAIVSIVIPVLVAILFYMPKPELHPGFDIRILPLFHAILNSATAVLLVASLYFIKNKQVKAHKITNIIAVVLSIIFLLSYVTYHSLAPETKFADLNHNGIVEATEKAAVGGIRYVYYFLLLTHIVLAAIIVPFVLFTLLRAFQNDIPRHRKIARITWPIWFYVAVTGVVVYIMISPYYH